jgi:hypothetical protein
MDRIVFIVCEAGCNGCRNKTPLTALRGTHDQKSILIAHGLDKHRAACSTSWWHIDWFDIFADCRCRMVFTMTYEEFINFVRAECMLETIYDDSEGRTILVICLLDAYTMINKAQKKEENT